jgi:ubiquinone/menaquinone biosynthesis C-methylase UbiE
MMLESHLSKLISSETNWEGVMLTVPAPLKISANCYAPIAGEYYDSRKHPTCSNFRAASSIYLKEALEYVQLGSAVLDIGAGCSLAAEILSERNKPLNDLIIIDGAAEMLVHSQAYLERGVTAVVGDARLLPIASGNVSTIICSLGDPFNVQAFWNEVSRCLIVGGFCIFTSPSYEWANSFRRESTNEQSDSAYFELVNGKSIYVPSFVVTAQRQERMIEKAGLRLVRSATIASSQVPLPHSPKISGKEGIVMGFVATKD